MIDQLPHPTTLPLLIVNQPVYKDAGSAENIDGAKAMKKRSEWIQNTCAVFMETNDTENRPMSTNIPFVPILPRDMNEGATCVIDGRLVADFGAHQLGRDPETDEVVIFDHLPRYQVKEQDYTLLPLALAAIASQRNLQETYPHQYCLRGLDVAFTTVAMADPALVKTICEQEIVQHGQKFTLDLDTETIRRVQLEYRQDLAQAKARPLTGNSATQSPAREPDGQKPEV